MIEVRAGDEVVKRALTLWPEWAWAILYLDKRVENRGWALPIGEWIGLHAGKSIGGRPGKFGIGDGVDSLAEMARRAGWGVAGTYRRATFASSDRNVVWELGAVPTSAIVGAIRVVSVDAPNQGDLGGWRVPDAHGNRLEVRPLARPVPMRGALGLWALPPDCLGVGRSLSSTP